MTDDPNNLDGRRAAAGQRESAMRRRPANGQPPSRPPQARPEDLEAPLLAEPARTWIEVMETCRFRLDRDAATPAMNALGNPSSAPLATWNHRETARSGNDDQVCEHRIRNDQGNGRRRRRSPLPEMQVDLPERRVRRADMVSLQGIGRLAHAVPVEAARAGVAPAADGPEQDRRHQS